MYDWDGYGTYFATNGEFRSYEGVNAWTTFNGDYVPDVTYIDIEMAAAGLTNSGTVVIEAVIQDESGDWFVSDANCPDTAGTTGIIDATATTWRKLNSAPIINTPLNVGAAGTPDLTRIYGCGVNYRDLGTGYPSVRIDSLKLVSTGTGIPVNSSPHWNSDPLFKASAIEGRDYPETLAADASDPDVGDILTFSLISGPSWLSVATDGQLSGVPADGDTGSNVFTVRVTDDEGLYDDATLNIYVFNRYTGELGFSDFAKFAERWLDTGCGSCGGAELDGDGDVDIYDMAIFAGLWLK